MKAHNFLEINQTGMVITAVMGDKMADEKLRLLEQVV